MRQRLHERGFICYRHRFRCGYIFRLHDAGRDPVTETGRFENAD